MRTIILREREKEISIAQAERHIIYFKSHISQQCNIGPRGGDWLITSLPHVIHPPHAPPTNADVIFWVREQHIGHWEMIDVTM